MLLEVPVDNADDLQAAISAGADRIELCSALELGGLTPSIGLMALAQKSPCPVRVLIRPRAGDFEYSQAEIEQMKADIQAVIDYKLEGIVIGAGNPKGLDLNCLQTLLKEAKGLRKTLHRVVDLLQDPLSAVEPAIDLGFDHILTSGGAPTALEGSGVIAQMHQRSAGRITIMAGSGISPSNVEHIIGTTGVLEVHASCRQPKKSDPNLTRLGFASDTAAKLNPENISQIKDVLFNHRISS